MAFAALFIQPQNETIGDLRSLLDQQSKNQSMTGWVKLIRGALGGTIPSNIKAVLASARASQTVTCDISAAVDGTDDITIGGAQGGTISVVASPATEDDMDGGTTDAEFADNLAAAVNAHSAISKLVYAVSDGASIVTLYSVMPGPVGNLITLAETGNGFTLGAAALASGASDEVDSYEFGYDPAL